MQLGHAAASSTAWCTFPSQRLPLQTQQQQHRPAPCSNSSSRTWTTQSSRSTRDRLQDQQMWGSHSLRTWREARGPALQVGMFTGWLTRDGGGGGLLGKQQVHCCICACMHHCCGALHLRAFAAPSCSAFMQAATQVLTMALRTTHGHPPPPAWGLCNRCATFQRESPLRGFLIDNQFLL